MKVTIEVGAHETSGLTYVWVPGSEIFTSAENGEILIRGNPAGLLSLAQHLATLAQDRVPAHSSLELDDYNGLDSGSTPLILERSE